MEERPFAPPKRYEKTGGFWTPGPDSRVLLVGERRDELSGLVSLLEEEYPALAAMARVEEEPPRPGDVALCLGRPEELAGAETFREGYVLHVGQWVELTAQSLRGAVYGLRRMMELAGEGGVPPGTLADWPDSGERALHLDMGRKHYTPEWIARRIRDMSRNRMNTLWLHFSETEGFRIACDSHPEVPSLLYHSKEEIRGLIRLANAYQIDVNPSLDSPGHLGQALREHPRWQLPRRDGSRLHSALDITNPDAVGFFRDLLDEYMDLFSGSKVFHIGGDEFIDFRDFSPYPVMDAWAKERLGPEYTGVDTYVHYLNEITARIRAGGFHRLLEPLGRQYGPAVRLPGPGAPGGQLPQRLPLLYPADGGVVYRSGRDAHPVPVGPRPLPRQRQPGRRAGPAPAGEPAGPAAGLRLLRLERLAPPPEGGGGRDAQPGRYAGHGNALLGVEMSV